MDKSVPFDLTAERATLGSILLDREAIIAVAETLAPEDFYLEKHGTVYAAMLACYAQRVPPDLATVAGELRRREQIDLVGGLTFLGEVLGEVPTAVHIEYYAANVRRAATLRRLIEAGGTIAALGYREDDDLDAVLSQAEARLEGVRGRTADTGYVPIGQAVNELFTAMERRQEQRGEPTGVITGFTDLDTLTGGLQKGDLIVVGARPSQGKTALELSIAYNVAHHTGEGVGVFSMEMGRDQLTQRMLSMHTGLALQRIRVGDLGQDELTLAFAGMGRLSELPIYIDDTPALSISGLRSRARRMCAQRQVSLLCVDYLQLMTGSGRGENRVQEVAEISRGLKQLARELNVPVLALSQLSRNVDQRPSHVPVLSDFRESGAIEQDSDIAIGLYREETYDKDSERKGIVDLHVLKHRNGPLGMIALRFAGRTTQFQNLERYRAPVGY
ncbi:replicative DNA helicase [Chloroflexales bacterium ZM16-3]|nr:replicative DNA helicase [Chloroflexales bacterium ZM16-3]